MIDSLTPEERRSLILSVGTHRKQRTLSPVEVAELFQKAIANGATQAACARLAGFSGTSMVGTFLQLSQLSANVRHMTGWGRERGTLPFSSAAALARLPPAEHDEAFRLALENMLNWKEVQQVVQIALRAKVPVEDAVSQVLELRPTVERQYVFIGGITDTAVIAHLAGLRQYERDSLLRRIGGVLFPDAAREAQFRLGPDRFTIVSPAPIVQDGDAVEPAVVAALRERLSDA